MHSGELKPDPVRPAAHPQAIESLRATLPFDEPQDDAEPCPPDLPESDDASQADASQADAASQAADPRVTQPAGWTAPVEADRDPAATVDQDFDDIEVLTRQYLEDLLSKYAGASPQKPSELAQKPQSQQQPQRVEPARVYTGPTPAPERNVDYQGMRQLANDSVRDKIQTVDRSRFRRAVACLALAVLATLLCLGAAVFADAVHSTAFHVSVALLFAATILSARFWQLARSIERDYAPRT